VADDEDKYEDYEALATRVFNHYKQKIGDISKERLQLHSLAEMKARVLKNELDPQNDLMSPEDKLILRTRLSLPPPKAAPTPEPSQQAAQSAPSGTSQ
jgi:hypothetical protein